MKTNGIFSVQILLNGVVAELAQTDIVELNLVEDIFTICMTGNISFYDKTGWTELLEVIGLNPIAIIYEVNGVQIQKQFMVYHYEALVEEISINQVLKKAKWYLIEPIAFSLINKRYSKAWGEGVLGSDIIGDICSNMLYLKTENMAEFEPTLEKFDNFYMPYWTPAESIKWLMKRCSGEYSRLPGYLFYCNSKGVNFTTLESLVTSKEREYVTSKTEYGMTKIDRVKYIFSGGEGHTNMVLSWHINPPDLKEIKHLSTTQSYGFNFDGKKILDPIYTYANSIRKYSILGRFDLYGDISNEALNMSMDCEANTETLDNIHYGNFIKRYSKQLSVGLVVRGESRRYAGMIVDIAWKSANQERRTHKMMEGLYLVKSITHQFTSGANGSPSPAYRQLLTCIKTGYNESTYNNLMKIDKTKQIIDTYAGKP